MVAKLTKLRFPMYEKADDLIAAFDSVGRGTHPSRPILHTTLHSAEVILSILGRKIVH